MWKNIAQPDTPQIATRIACWIPKSTNIHSEYVVIIASPLQQVARTRLNIKLYIQCVSC